MRLKLDIEALEKIAKENPSKVLVFLPSGAKKLAFKIKSIFSEHTEVVFAANPHYGGCDIPPGIVEAVDPEVVVLVGHNLPRFLKLSRRVVSIDLQVTDINPTFIPQERKIGIVFALNYREEAMKYAEYLRKKGKEVIIPEKYGPFCMYPGQITGCDVEAARSIKDRVEAFVVVAGGKFHAEAVARLGVKTYTISGEVIHAKRRNPLPLLIKGKRIAVIYSLKLGQKFHWVRGIEKKLKKMGKEVIVIFGDEITKEVINFRADLFVINACPRIVEDFLEEGYPAISAVEVLTHI